MSDIDINHLSKLSNEGMEQFLEDKYVLDDDKLLEGNSSVFYMEKGWDVTKFLLKKVDSSEKKVLDKLDSKFIKSKDIKLINEILKKITVDHLISVLDTNEMIENEVYRAEIKDKDYINYHLKVYQLGCKKASELNSGIVICFY